MCYNDPLPLAASCGNSSEGAEADQGKKVAQQSSTTRVPTSAAVSLSETDNPYQLFGVSVLESSPTSDLSDKRTEGSSEEAG